jgi:nitroreductase
MEVGHAGQNIHLQAVALGLATVEVGASRDEEVRKVLGLEEQIKPLYIMPAGRPL